MFYDAVVGRWFVGDPAAAEYYSQSLYHFSGNNPNNLHDANGMDYDWFQNVSTGDVYYNSTWKEGDETRLGENWVYMGPNGMFYNGSLSTTDASILFENQGLGDVSMTLDYDKSIVFKDAKVTSVTIEGMFKGNNAKKLMGNLGYDFKPVLFKFHSDITTEYHPEPFGQVTITYDNSNIEEVLESRYISQDLVLKSTLILKNYKAPQNDLPKLFGPMYSIRNQSWTYRKNIYGKSAFGTKAGKVINWLEKNTPWKSIYEGLWKKVLK